MKFLALSLLALAASPAHASPADLLGTYTGTVSTGSDLTPPCTVKVEASLLVFASITVTSDRAGTLSWAHFRLGGPDEQRNAWNSGFVQLNRNADGSLSSVMMQYETNPNPLSPFNLSTVNEFCTDLHKQ